MNNEQFRKLLLANAASPSSGNGENSPQGISPSGGGARSLGSRAKSSIPMTPRAVSGGGGINFARQVAENSSGGGSQKKPRTSMPKGSRLAEGYVDRSKIRNSEEEDDRAARVHALEESLKNDEIDQATFERLVREIAGGDLSSTHLVKGLDFKLLEKVRKGEDVYGEKAEEQNHQPDLEPEDNMDEELERIETAEVAAVAKEKVQKKGQLSTVSLAPGQKRTRDQILAELKAAREAAKVRNESALGSRFKKIGARQAAGSRIERDSKGREVLIIVDEDGHEKRKVRKIAGDDEAERAAFIPDKSAKPLGMEVPEHYKKKLEQEQQEDDGNVNIFDDVGSDYDPLAGLRSDSDDEASEAEEGQIASASARAKAPSDAEADDSKLMPPPPRPGPPSQARNYFKDSRTSLVSETTTTSSSLSDPAVLAALRKAKALNAAAKSEEEERDAERDARLKKLLESSERDAADMDLGFGTNRIADEEESEETQIKLSTWGDGDDEGKSGGAKAKRKRGPKKRKADGNNAADVMRVLEQRNGAPS